MDTSHFILLGKILSPHGVRGQLKVWSYAEIPENLTAYGPLYDKSGKRTFTLKLEGETKNGFIVRIEGVNDRDLAEALRNTELYVPRSALPEAKPGQYYQNDLIGLPVFTETDATFGHVAAFHDFGAGTLVEIRFADGGTEL